MTIAVTYRDLGALIPYINNARTHSDEQIGQIAASIREFGFTNPILVDGDNGIIAGHGRALAAARLGMSEAPCIELAGLSEAQRKAYILADNRLAQNAGWDEDLIRVELVGLDKMEFDLSLIGFDEYEIEDFVNGVHFAPGSADEQGRLDEKTPITCPNCSHEFTP